MQNQALNVFVAGLSIVLLILLLQDPGTQRSLVYYLGLESDNTTTPKNNVVTGGKIETGKISRVIDGDTVVLEDGRTIRYLNADTPETKKPNTAVQCYGPEASAYNKNLMEGKNVTLVADKQNEDKYGRDLRFVFLEGRDISNIQNSINAELVKNGYARALVIDPNNTYESDFNKLQSDAQSQKIGLWGVCAKPFVE
jgi:endonuclease YncB( thermonuclease family)